MSMLGECVREEAGNWLNSAGRSVVCLKGGGGTERLGVLLLNVTILVTGTHVVGRGF